MAEEVTLYIDYRSPFSYLATADALALERDFALDLRWRPFPVDLQGAYGGEVEERERRHWQKVRYLYMDARRLANRQGLIVRGPRKIFDPTIAHIGHLFAETQGLRARYHDRVSTRFWRRELDIEDRAEMAAIVAEIGGDAIAFAEYLTGPGPDDYAAVAAEGERQGVFGVPTFVFADELFWGTDRIWMLRERLEAKQPQGDRRGVS
jgi:2-hydroxychromene-2-carboxylate isomerase